MKTGAEKLILICILIGSCISTVKDREKYKRHIIPHEASFLHPAFIASSSVRGSGLGVRKFTAMKEEIIMLEQDLEESMF